MDATPEQQALLSTLPAGPGEKRLAIGVVLILLVAFAATLPFAKVQLARVDAFIPAYQAALLINDLITAVLLLSQFALVRSRALLVLACGYLFTTLILIPHMLTFPGVFAPTGLLGAGPQTTAWLYMFWHGGFPLAVIAYGLLKGDLKGNGNSEGGFGVALAIGVAATVCVAVALTLLATYWHPVLPAIMRGNNYSPALTVVVTAVWGLSVVALILLAVRRPHTVLDVWLMVVLCAWVCDIALSAMLNQGRYDVGFYAGRFYGLLAASFVLLVLLSETTTLYSRYARALMAERLARERRLNEMETILAHLARVSEMGQIAATLTHEVNQPLTAVSNYIGAISRMAETGKAEMIARTAQLASEQADRAAGIIRHLREFLVKGETSKRPQDLPATIERAVSLALVGVQRNGLAIETKFDSRAATAVMDRVQIEQVLFNLVRNAAEAMADSPRREIVISTARVGDKVEVSVADTGPGLSETVRAKLFQPFVTTKSSGMGVGLSICRFIVEAHGGELRAQDNPGGGTVFRFTLPAQVAQTLDRAAG